MPAKILHHVQIAIVRKMYGLYLHLLNLVSQKVSFLMAFVMILTISQCVNLMEVIAVQAPLVMNFVHFAIVFPPLTLLNQQTILTNATICGLEMGCAMMSIIIKIAYTMKMIVVVIKVKHNLATVLYVNAFR